MKKLRLFGLMIVILFISSVSYSQTPFSFGLTGGANFPLGEFNNVYKTGFSVEGSGFYSFSGGSSELSFSIGYNGFTYKNEYFTDAVLRNFNATGVSGFDVSWNATDIPVMVGLKFNIPSPVITPYFWGEIGAHFMSFNDRFNGTQVTTSSGNTVNVNNLPTSSSSESVTAFGYSIGGGLTIPLLPKIKLDINVKYNGNGAVFSKEYEVWQNANSHFVNPELKNLSFLTTRMGILISL
jgi:opacity protein-like surface antigen